MRRTIKLIDKDNLVIHITNSEKYTREDLLKLYTSLQNRKQNLESQLKGIKEQIPIFKKAVIDLDKQIAFLKKKTPTDWLEPNRIEVKAKLAGDANGKTQ